MSLLFLMLLSFGNFLMTNGASIRTKRQTQIRLWPDGVIPYNIPDTYTDSEKLNIRVAMNRWEEKTCVKFVPWSDDLRESFGEVRYINFYKGGTCFSRHGFHQHQPQVIGIGSNCLGIATITHELGHAIGMKHTMERVDRDFYIDIHYENLNLDSRRNYDTTEMKGQYYPLYGTPYDYKSIMHYGPKAYSSNGEVVMVTKDPAYQSVIGRAKDVSFYDALYVNMAYKCEDKCDRSTRYSCLNGGFIGGSNCFCICPDGFIGHFCEVPLPGFQNIISWNCEEYWFFASGRCYKPLSYLSSTFQRAADHCGEQGAGLATFKTDSDMDWILRVIDEQLVTSSATSSFWIGLRRNANETKYRYSDGTFYDTDIMPIHEMGSSTQEGCVSTDGVRLTGVSCNRKIGRGYICMKNFDPTCGGRYRLSGRGTYIHSPGYPANYPRLTTCQYILQAPSSMKIEMRFDHFDFEIDPGCKADYLQVQNKTDILDEGIRYCSKVLMNKTIESEGNVAILTMKTDKSVHKTGFRLFARAVPLIQRPTQPPRPPSLLDSLSKLFNKSPDTDESDGTSTDFLQTIWKLFHSTSISKVL